MAMFLRKLYGRISVSITSWPQLERNFYLFNHQKHHILIQVGPWLGAILSSSFSFSFLPLLLEKLHCFWPKDEASSSSLKHLLSFLWEGIWWLHGFGEGWRMSFWFIQPSFVGIVWSWLSSRGDSRKPASVGFAGTWEISKMSFWFCYQEPKRT